MWYLIVFMTFLNPQGLPSTEVSVNSISSGESCYKLASDISRVRVSPSGKVILGVTSGCVKHIVKGVEL